MMHPLIAVEMPNLHGSGYYRAENTLSLFQDMVFVRDVETIRTKDLDTNGYFFWLLMRPKCSHTVLLGMPGFEHTQIEQMALPLIVNNRKLLMDHAAAYCNAIFTQDESAQRQFFLRVDQERIRQWEKHGNDPHSYIEWLALVMEELGELAQAVNKYHFSEAGAVPPEILTELVHVAASATAFGEQLLDGR